MSEQPGSWERLVVDAPSARTMARPAEHKVAIETGLRVPMRDGAELGATLWRPAALGRYPVLLERAPHRLDAHRPRGRVLRRSGLCRAGRQPARLWRFAGRVWRRLWFTGGRWL